jgi:hypothetical protein
MLSSFVYDKSETAIRDELGENAMKASPKNTGELPSLVFATYADSDDDLYWATVLAESIRGMGGRLRDCPIWIYMPEDIKPSPSKVSRTDAFSITLKSSSMPNEAREFYYSGKVFAAGLAERNAEQDFDILAWLDADAVFVREPSDFLLDMGIDLGYRPVQLVIISSPLDNPISEYWKRIYDMLDVSESAIFPMTTTVDGVSIRPHFNAGMVIVRPQVGILKKWADNFTKLISDSAVVRLCNEEKLNNIYLHQAALAGTILKMIPPSRMRDLPPTYNYAVFITDKMAAGTRIPSLDDVVMFRHGQHYVGIDKLEGFAGSSRIFLWLKERWKN